MIIASRQITKIWEDAVSAVREVAEYAPDVDISIEYKPNEPRAYSIFPNVTTCLLAVEEAGCANLGITLDFAHVLFANEIPAFAAAMVARRSRLMGLDLNDGWGKRDDGLMVASVNPRATLEFLWQMQRDGYTGLTILTPSQTPAAWIRCVKPKPISQR